MEAKLAYLEGDRNKGGVGIIIWKWYTDNVKGFFVRLGDKEDQIV